MYTRNYIVWMIMIYKKKVGKRKVLGLYSIGLGERGDFGISINFYKKNVYFARVDLEEKRCWNASRPRPPRLIEKR